MNALSVLPQLLHQAVLFLHVIAFAMTLAAVLREDLRLAMTRRIDAPRLLHTARAVSIGLSVLWASGLTLVAIDAATSVGPWLPSAKLQAKLIVVGVLTLNGWALHAWVFPRLWGVAVRIDRRLWPAAALGAISSASWVTASFVGVARIVSPWLSLAGFMALYGAVAGVCLALALTSLRTHMPEADSRSVMPWFRRQTARRDAI
jgi:hypothetical protein